MTSITLYFAKWCGHCHNFLPVWEKIKKWCASNNVTAKEFEDEHIEKMKMTGENDPNVMLGLVDGYPTIIINRGNSDATVIRDRSEDSIIRLLKGEVIQTGGGKSRNQNGGTCSLRGDMKINYKEKYVKYKNKYMNLKKQIMK